MARRQDFEVWEEKFKPIKNKRTKFTNLFNLRLNKICYVEGHFESEKYFLDYSNKIKEKLNTNKQPLRIAS